MKKMILKSSTAMLLLFCCTFLTAQNNYDYPYGANDYEYDDNVVIINDYGNDVYRDGRRDKRRVRSQSRIRSERRWKASIIRRAYRIAEADGRVTRRERRELRELENELGIYRRGRRDVCR